MKYIIVTICLFCICVSQISESDMLKIEDRFFNALREGMISLITSEGKGVARTLQCGDEEGFVKDFVKPRIKILDGAIAKLRGEK